MGKCEQCNVELSKYENVYLYSTPSRGQTQGGYLMPQFCSKECCDKYISEGGKLRIPIADKYPNINNLPKYKIPPPPRQKPSERKEGEQPKRYNRVKDELNPDYFDFAMKLILELERERESAKKLTNKFLAIIYVLGSIDAILMIFIMIK